MSRGRRRGSKREEDSREPQLRFALERALNDHPNVPVSSLLEGALATLIRDYPIDGIAFEMAKVALDALVHAGPAERKVVRAWHAQQHGCSDADSDALDIIDIARAVEQAAYFYRFREPWVVDRGPRAVEHLRAFLEASFGTTFDDLEDWIARHARKHARGTLTTAGIVAKIVHRGRLLGARGSDEGKTLRRVTMILKRHNFTRLVK